MTRPALDRAVLSSRLAQIAQLVRTYVSKTDQTDQTDQRFETAEEFGAPPEPELTSCPQELTSGTTQRPAYSAPCARNRSSPALQVTWEGWPP
jgi:hypothetical protein